MSMYQAQYVLSKCFKNKTNRLSANNQYSVQDYLNAVYDEENDALRICFDGVSPDGGEFNIFVEGYAKKEDGKVIAFYSDDEFKKVLTPNSEQFYVDIPSDNLYRWNSFEYVSVGGSISDSEDTENAYPNDKGKELETKIQNIEKTIQNQYVIVSNTNEINLLNRQTAICVVENCTLNLPEGELGSFVKIFIAKGASVTVKSGENFISEDKINYMSLEQELTYLLLIFDVNSKIWFLTYADADSHLVL